jgi:hypothetical protein
MSQTSRDRSEAPGSLPGPEERLRDAYAVPASAFSAICSDAVPCPCDGFVALGSGVVGASAALAVAAARRRDS